MTRQENITALQVECKISEAHSRMERLREKMNTASNVHDFVELRKQFRKAQNDMEVWEIVDVALP